VRGEHEQVLVDEFQDINRAMGVLLHTLAGEASELWAVGDANQAIYRFRGASPANLRQFTAEYPGAHIHTLQQNYRSVPPVLDAAAALAHNALHSDTALEPARSEPPAPAVTLAAAADESRELAGLAEAIKQREAEGRALGEQVVLCRTRRQGQRVAAALAAAGIETHLSAPLLEEPAVKDLFAVVLLAADRSGIGLLRAGMVSDHSYFHADALAVLRVARERQVAPGTLLAGDLKGVEGLSRGGRRGLRRLAVVVGRLRHAPDTVTGLARYLFGYTSIGRGLFRRLAAGDALAAAEASHLAQVLALAHTFEDQRRAALAGEASPAAIRGNYADWSGLLDYVRVVSALRAEAGGAHEAPGAVSGVRVLTVHASKGLEFPVVYLPGLVERRFPMQRRAQPAPLPAPLATDTAPDNEDAHLAEEACLFYVALTRARDELVLSYAGTYGRTRYKPSPFLLPLIARLGARLRRVAWSGHFDDDETLHLVAQEPVVARGRHPSSERPPAAGPDRAVSVAALETYNRCPRQYAYRYVYGLHPREIGLAALRHALHETLGTIRQGEAGEGHLTLAEALAAFDSSWESEIHRAPSQPNTEEEAAEEIAADRPREAFIDVYRRHGRQIVERIWATVTSDDPQDAATTPATTTVRYELPVRVRAGEREIELTLDRVEAAAPSPAPDGRVQRRGAAGAAATAAAAGPQAARFVRHRVGRGAPLHA
ncbi:MAG: 3'-5' exonuclease, partial [Ktedonobacterales bacterium]